MFVPWPYLIGGGILAVIGALTVLVFLAKLGLLEALGDIF